MSEMPHGDYEKFYKRWGDPTVELHNAYNLWLADMDSREGNELASFEFDLEKYPEQSIYVPKTEAIDLYPEVPDSAYYEAVRMKMIKSVGESAQSRLLDQLGSQQVSSEDSRLLIDRLIANRQQGRNTLVVTSHFTFPEMGYFKVLRLLQEQDRPNITKGGVLISKLMTRQSYDGKKLVDQFRPISNIYFSHPKSASAEKYGVPKNATKLGNALFMKALKPDLQIGGFELDAALTGKQVVPARNEDGSISHYEIPNIDSSSVKLIENFDDIIGVTLINSPVTGQWEMGISPLLDIKELSKTNSSAEIVDLIYADIAKSVESFTGKDVDYKKVSTNLGRLAIDQSE